MQFANILLRIFYIKFHKDYFLDYSFIYFIQYIFRNLFYFMCMGCFACMYVCVPWGVPGAHEGQERALDSLELELQMWAAKWVLGIKPRLSGRVASALNYWDIFLGPLYLIYLMKDGYLDYEEFKDC